MGLMTVKVLVVETPLLLKLSDGLELKSLPCCVRCYNPKRDMMKLPTLLLLLLTSYARGRDVVADTGSSMQHGQSPPFFGGIVAAAPLRTIELEQNRLAQESPETKVHVHPPEELNTKSTPSRT